MIFNKCTAMLLSTLLTASALGYVPAAAETEAAPKLHLAKFDDTDMQRQALAADSAFLTVDDGISAHTSDLPLPSSFDLRSRGLVSAVKEQEPYGTCWSFAAINSIETSLIDRNPEIDLSEWHLAYYTYCSTFGYPYKEDDLFDEGSWDVRQEAGMLTSWMGPVDEKDARYGDASIRDSQKTLEDLYAEADYHVTEARLYPLWSFDDTMRKSQIDAIKRAIYDNIALDGRFDYNEDCFNSETNAYCYNYDLCDPDYTDGHAISIVGWDDAFPASAFYGNVKANGAFLCKNSWGTNWGDYGYFWLSYYDESIYDIISFKAEHAQPDMILYQHDSYGNHSSFAAADEGEGTVYAANVFTAETDGFLYSVMLCNMVNDDVWDVTIYTGLTDENDPTSGTAAATTQVMLTDLGYQTVDLPAPVQLRMGERFSIVAKISGEDLAYHIPCEYASHSEWRNSDDSIDYYDTTFTLNMLMENFNEGESFYSADGSEWFDVYLNGTEVTDQFDAETGTTSTYTNVIGNICMKAVTRNAGVVTFSDYNETVPSGTPIKLYCAEDAEIYYSVDDGDFQLYTEPIECTEAMTIRAYANTGENVIYTRSYRPASAGLSSLLCIEDGFCWYADTTDEEDPYTLHYSIFPETQTLGLLPVSTGKVTVGDTVLPSGQVTQVPVSDEDLNLTIMVEQEGLTPAVYTLVLTRMQDVIETLGDVNLDGNVNASDAAQILIYSAAVGAGDDPELPDGEWMIRADFNLDNVINASDAAQILIYAAQVGANG